MEQAMETAVDFAVENQSVFEKASKVIGAVDLRELADNIGSAVDAIPVSGILSGAGAVAAAFPFIYPAHILLKTIGDAVRTARFNKDSANMLLERCVDTEKVIGELAPTLADIAKEDSELMKPLEKALEDSLEFLDRFTSKGFLQTVWRGCKNVAQNKENEHRLSLYDKRIVGAIQNLSLRIDNKQLQLQILSAEKMDRLFDVLAEKVGAETDLSKVSPVVMAEVAQIGGCSSPEDLRGELEGMGYKLDEIKSAVDQVLQRLEVMDGKLDYIGNSINDSRKLQLEANELHKQTLAEMKQLKCKTGLSIPQQYSTRAQVAHMAQKAVEVKKAGGLRITVVHPVGVGLDSYVRLDGMGGADGHTHTGSHRPAASGYAGQAGEDGGDGLDGEDGHDGDDGHDGLDGADADDFEVMIKCISENKDEGIRAYRIEYAGRGRKDEEIVELKFPGSIIYIDGCGGAGGRGGSGGNGAAGGAGGGGGRGGDGIGKQDGGCGGVGGNGGRGGVGGIGGDGGNGGRGADVVIHTDDPAVLRLVEANVSGGRGGPGGSRGLPGMGGLGGPGGLPGRGGTYKKPCIKVNEKGKLINSQEIKTRPNGKRGKYGTMGHTGKRRTGKPSRSGKDGEYGKVCFCIYNSEGLCESGGAPFRLMFSRKQMRVLRPISLPFSDTTPVVFDEHANTTLFLYGGKLRFGPVSPMNIGGLSCPESELVASVLYGPGSSSLIAQKVLTFPSVPAAQSTNYGELPADKQKELEITIPGMKDACFGHKQVDVLAWPWVVDAAPFSVRISALFRILLSVDDVAFTGNPDLDGDLMCARDYPITVDVPLELVSGPNASTKNVLGPSSIALGEKSEHPLLFCVHNKLQSDPITKDHNPHRCILRVVGAGFKPIVTCANSDVMQQTLPEVNGHEMDTYELNVPDIPPGGSYELTFRLQVPTEPGPELGALIHIRSELYNNEGILECSPPMQIRIVPAVPVQHGGVNVLDILFFVDSTMTPPDFKYLMALCTKLGMRAHFLDCEHDYKVQSKPPVPTLVASAGGGATTANRCVSSALWEGFKGKCTVVWLPPSKQQAGALPHADLQHHLEAGGSLICNSRVHFKWSRALTGSPEMGCRRHVMCSNSIKLSGLPNSEQVTSTNITGMISSTLVMNILIAMSTRQKLDYLHSAGRSLTILVGSTLVPNFYFKKRGIFPCFSTPKIAPLEDSGVCIRDFVAAALRCDISVDLFFYEKHSNNDHCFALRDVVQFYNEKIARTSQLNGVNDVACVMAATLTVTNVDDATLFSAQSMKKWSRLRRDLQKVLKKCTSLGNKGFSMGGVKSFVARLALMSPVGEDMFSKSSRSHRLNDSSIVGFAMLMPNSDRK